MEGFFTVPWTQPQKTLVLSRAGPWLPFIVWGGGVERPEGTKEPGLRGESLQCQGLREVAESGCVFGQLQLARYPECRPGRPASVASSLGHTEE